VRATADGTVSCWGCARKPWSPGWVANRYALDRLVRRSPWLWAPIRLRHHREQRRPVCWGEGAHGESSGPGSSPTGRSVSRPDLHDVVHIAAGPNGTCAVRADQTLWCWGVGFGKVAPVPIPVKLGKLGATPASWSSDHERASVTTIDFDVGVLLLSARSQAHQHIRLGKIARGTPPRDRVRTTWNRGTRFPSSKWLVMSTRSRRFEARAARCLRLKRSPVGRRTPR